MNLLRFTAAVAGSLVLLTSGHAADPAKGFDKYNFTRTRNVFDPDRRAVAPVVAKTSTPRTSGSRQSTVTLTGTMSVEGKNLAFFASARSEFNRIVSTGETLAGFKLKGISIGTIEVEHDGKSQILSVGESLPIAGALPAGSPEVEEPADPAADAAAAADPAAPATPATPAPGSPDDIMKRMLERRQKEMSR